mmetsp:Transcript_13598/g.16668  ORF Transcript_13598/g.16668 Transcript_13598/m.16668 type:complete len:91 (-) Transcript_13598:1549-1821(-)
MTLPGVTHYAPKSKIVIGRLATMMKMTTLQSSQFFAYFLLILGCFVFFTSFTSHKHISSSAHYLHTHHDQLTFRQVQRSPMNSISLTFRN